MGLVSVAKCFLAILSFHWYEQFKGGNRTDTENFSSDHSGLHGTTARNEPKVKNVRAKNTKLLFFIVKYANLGRSCRRRGHGSLSFLFSVEI